MDELVELWRRVDDLRELRDASELSGEGALEAARAVARVRSAADVLLAPYAARVDELSDPSSVTRLARWKGFPSAASLLSHVTGLSVGEAGKLIGIGRALADAGEPASEPPIWAVAEESRFDLAPEVSPLLPPAAAPEPSPPATVPTPRAISPLAAAIRAGTLGTEKANIIRRTLEDMVIETAETEQFLVEQAASLSLVELRRLCLVTLAERDAEGHALRETRLRKSRFLKFYEEPDGMIAIIGKLDPASAAPIKAWFDAETRAQVAAQRDVLAHEQRSLGQICADVFVAVARHAAGCERATTRPKTTMVIRFARTSLDTGEGFATCDGIEAPLTMSAALALAVDAEIAPLLLGECGEPLALGRAKRDATRAQRLAVAERDKGCAMCSAALSRCDAHHITEWSHGGLTDVDNLVMLCVGCHHRVHEYGWIIEIEQGHVWFVPPASVDPRRRRRPGSSARLAA